MPKRLGLTLERAKDDLEQFLERKSNIIRRLNELGVDPDTEVVPKEYTQLQGELKMVDAEIGESREWFIMHFLEDLSSASDRLEKLTRVFAILTALFILVSLPTIGDQIWGLLIRIWRLMGIDLPI